MPVTSWQTRDGMITMLRNTGVTVRSSSSRE